jgi:hypothetical protein
MILRIITASAAAIFWLSTAMSAFAGGTSTVNQTVIASTSTAISSTIVSAISISISINLATDEVEAIIISGISFPVNLATGETTVLNINGTTVEINRDTTTGAILVNGQPLVIDKLPNIGLMMTLAYD